MRNWARFALVAAALAASAGGAMAGRDVDAIKARGTLRCGMQGPSLAGFGTPDSQGKWAGFNVEFCRAVAITILGDPNKAEFVPLSSQARFPALASGEVDILVNNTTWTLSRDTNVNKFNFPAVIFYDGQAIMVPKKLNIAAAKQLNGATVCVQPGTTTELNLADYFRSNNLQFKPVVIENAEELRRAYDQGRCDVYTNDFSGLSADRTVLAKPADHIILPERLSKEPLGPAIRQGDEEMTNMVAWTIYGMIEAEELGVTKANVDDMATKSTDPRIKRLLGTDPGMGTALGAADGGYMRTIVKTFGNYGEIYDRHLGPATPLGLNRDQNSLWTKGGLLYAPPAR